MLSDRAVRVLASVAKELWIGSGGNGMIVHELGRLLQRLPALMGRFPGCQPLLEAASGTPWRKKPLDAATRGESYSCISSPRAESTVDLSVMRRMEARIAASCLERLRLGGSGYRLGMEGARVIETTGAAGQAGGGVQGAKDCGRDSKGLEVRGGDGSGR
eukprot:761212-Hanusia_phi.AAC.2